MNYLDRIWMIPSNNITVAAGSFITAPRPATPRPQPATVAPLRTQVTPTAAQPAPAPPAKPLTEGRQVQAIIDTNYSQSTQRALRMSESGRLVLKRAEVRARASVRAKSKPNVTSRVIK